MTLLDYFVTSKINHKCVFTRKNKPNKCCPLGIHVNHEAKIRFAVYRRSVCRLLFWEYCMHTCWNCFLKIAC